MMTTKDETAILHELLNHVELNSTWQIVNQAYPVLKHTTHYKIQTKGLRIKRHFHANNQKADFNFIALP